MQNLVNTSTAAIGYRTGKYWQFSSFDAAGATLSPIGTAAAPFSGYIVGDGTATVQHLHLAGTDSVGFLGVTELAVTIQNFTLDEVSVSGATAVGALIGLARGAVSVTDVSVSASVSASSLRASGLIGVAQAPVTLTSVSLAGSVSGAGVLGGLIGSAADSVQIKQASVNADLRANDSSVGGLVGTASSAATNPTLSIGDVLVVGSIAGQSNLAGLVAQLSGNLSATIVNAIQAANLRGTGSAIAGLINTTTSASLELKSVLNLARVTGSSSASGYDYAAALVYGALPPTLVQSQAYSWQGLSTSDDEYRPFVVGIDNQTTWKFNGSALNCSDFGRTTFWTNSASMGLSDAAGWNFDQTSSGYLPTLHSQFPDQAFHCMTTLLTDGIDEGFIVPWDGTATVPTLPFYDNATDRVFYFAAPNADQSISYRAQVASASSSYSVLLNSATLTVAAYGDATYTVPVGSRQADNVLGISFGIECDSAYPNIGQRTGESGLPFLITNFAELQCMSTLVNTSTAAIGYRSGKYWQFSSFSAAGAALSPIGTAAAPFSGLLTGDPAEVDGTATIRDLAIAGTDSTGFLGVTEGTVTIKQLSLLDVSVEGDQSVGAWVGWAGGSLSLEDSSISGVVQSAGNIAGGLVGHAQGAIRLNNVSAAGIVRSAGHIVGGLIGSTDSSAVIERARFDGAMDGLEILGGLLGAGSDNVLISQASVRVNVGSMSSNTSKIGGLVGTLSNANSASSLQVNNAVVLGSLLGDTAVAGLVGELSGNISATISNVIQAATITGQSGPTAGLINTLADSALELTSVLNLARVTGADVATAYDQSAALVYSSGMPTLVDHQAYRWLGLSASISVYRPFPAGLDSGSVWKFHGQEVSCSDFANPDFWTNSASMGLSTAQGWNFDAVAQGFIPALFGQLADQPFSCLTTLATDAPALGSIAAWDGSATRPSVPVFDSSTSQVVYFDAANADQYLE
jgi:hypothetical protein